MKYILYSTYLFKDNINFYTLYYKKLILIYDDKVNIKFFIINFNNNILIFITIFIFKSNLYIEFNKLL